VSLLRGLPIRLRLAVLFAIFLLVTVIGIGVFLLASLENELQREIDEGLWLRASRVEREIAAGGVTRLDPGAVRADILALSPLEELSLPGIYVQVIDGEGIVLATSPNLPGGALPLTPALTSGAMAGDTVYATVPVGSERVRVLLRPITSSGRAIGAVVVGESLHLLDVTQRSARQLLIVTAAVAALGCLLVSWWLTGRALNPVAEVTRIARRIRATGQLDQRIAEPSARDELRELTVTFNEMLDGIERTFARQREFLADASHELRGPLMVVRGNLNLLSRDLPGDERREAIQDAVGEVERISRLVSDLLFLAEVDKNEVVDRQPVALDEVVAQVWQRAQQLDAGAHLLVLAANQPVSVLGDRERLGQLLWNLVENALRYTPPGGRVELGLHHKREAAEVTVADTGVGIEPQHLPRIFERFYRADRARPRQAGSTGLGLAIARQIAEAHGGRIRVGSAPGQGSTFTVVLPELEP
jgi:two-component system OmpR family sensor kinase